MVADLRAVRADLAAAATGLHEVVAITPAVATGHLDQTMPAAVIVRSGPTTQAVAIVPIAVAAIGLSGQTTQAAEIGQIAAVEKAIDQTAAMATVRSVEKAEIGRSATERTATGRNAGRVLRRLKLRSKRICGFSARKIATRRKRSQKGRRRNDGFFG